MKIKLHSLKTKQRGAVFFWILAFVVIVVIAVIVTLIVINLCRKLEKFKPQWDDVDAIMVEEVEKARLIYGPDADITAQIPEVFPLGFGLAFRSDRLDAIPAAEIWQAAENPGVGWQTNEQGNAFIALPLDQIDSAFPPIDLNVPAMFYHRYVVVTNQ